MIDKPKRRGRPPGTPNPNAGRPSLGSRPKRHISLRLDADLLDQLEARLTATGKTKADAFETAIALYLY